MANRIAIMGGEPYADWIERDGKAQRLFKAYCNQWPEGDTQCMAIGDEFYVRFENGEMRHVDYVGDFDDEAAWCAQCGAPIDPDGNEYPNAGVYLEVVPDRKLVFTDAYTAGWVPSAKPFMTAIVTFERLASNHPGTAEAGEAAAQAAHALYRLARRYPEDEAVQTRALAAFAATLRDYPGHADREVLQEEMADLLARRYNHHFDAARFYDSPRFKPETAVAAYEEFLRRFPSAPQADDVRRRLGELDGAGKE